MFDKPVNLANLVYPIFQIGTEKPLFENDVSFYIQHYLKEDKETVIEQIRVIDDKGLEKDTLAKRRLLLMEQGIPLKKLGNSIHFLGDLIKIAKPDTWLIDSSGLVFQYKKSKRVKLVFKEIKSVYPIKGMGAIIEVKGIMSRFKVLYEPPPSYRYAGVLQDGSSYILYGVYDQLYKDTWRMV